MYQRRPFRAAVFFLLRLRACAGQGSQRYAGGNLQAIAITPA